MTFYDFLSMYIWITCFMKGVAVVNWKHQLNTNAKKKPQELVFLEIAFYKKYLVGIGVPLGMTWCVIGTSRFTFKYNIYRISVKFLDKIWLEKKIGKFLAKTITTGFVDLDERATKSFSFAGE